jgi:hypothetical protein
MTVPAWAASEVITGAPPASENDPNTTAPAAARILKSPLRRPGTDNVKAAIFAVGGTSIPVTPWVYEATTGTWVRLAAAMTIAAGVASYVDVPPDAQLFFQNGSATGAVTSRGVGFL